MFEGIGEGLKEFVKDLGKKAGTRPGWLYLLIIVSVAVPHLGLAESVGRGKWGINLSNEFWVALLTYVAYQVGDVLDKITFKKWTRGKRVPRYQPKELSSARACARSRLCVHDGVYDVSMKILEAAEKKPLAVGLLNEGAKCFRSLIVPAWIAALCVAVLQPFAIGISIALAATAIGALLAWYVYPRMKTRHITNLYRAIPIILDEDSRRPPDERRLDVDDVPGEKGQIRMFLWEGLPLTSARKVQKATRSQTK